MDKKKKSNFSLDKYKTHDGERGTPAQWAEAVRQALMLEHPDATVEEIEIKLSIKLTKLGKRKIKL